MVDKFLVVDKQQKQNKSDAVGQNNKDFTDSVGKIAKTMKKCDSVAQMKTRENERQPTYPLRLQALAPRRHSRRLGSEEVGRSLHFFAQ